MNDSNLGLNLIFGMILKVLMYFSFVITSRLKSSSIQSGVTCLGTLNHHIFAGSCGHRCFKEPVTPFEPDFNVFLVIVRAFNENFSSFIKGKSSPDYEVPPVRCWVTGV